ncbi:tryptophan--tRNA ligase [Catellatospora citrea]|uniref:Tryptophan--tRNA ligase n=1 Tax=Catellatospora citrea TaxID=53366 RepID=A0A8J3KF25_9ACTN|nr:tryptophan--tRNA ligase [Catellatospora citrea]RKE07577.1 tryptophanyl-tRNA synthetase [Catellatospora citrea]GIF95733.1 tryptophan--tRNA ligase 1 [Catellatospora citrea]
MTIAPTRARARRLSACKPTGRLQLGNLFGMILPLVAGQDDSETVTMLADLHSLTVEHDPAAVRGRTLEQAAVLLAAGVDPQRCTLYVQSHLPEHTQLHYLLECATGYGEAQRMVAFKEKAGRGEQVRLSLLTYPVLMAADILLHDTEQVPVGDDQLQHVELARTVANRFNGRYGPVFTVPAAVPAPVAARVMDLADPTAKMGKTNVVSAGVIGILDEPDVVRRKVMRAVTDGGSTVRHDRERQPGVTNLLEIYQACTGSTGHFSSYGQLKRETAEAVVAVLTPIQERYEALRRRPETVEAALAEGARRARPRAAATLRRAGEAIGLVSF